MSDREDTYTGGTYEQIPGGMIVRKKKKPMEPFVTQPKQTAKVITSPDDQKKYALQNVKGRWLYSK